MRNFIMKHFSQRGMVLITGLVFLIVLTLIATSIMDSSVFAEKMTYNSRDTTSAFEAAESALGDGELWIQNQITAPKPVTACSTPPCLVWNYDALGNFYSQSGSWWQSQGRAFSTTLSGVATQPRYIIEYYSYVPYELSPEATSQGKGYYFYRVTARGNGISNNAYAVVQSIYSTQYN